MGLRQAEIPREGIRESDREARENLTKARAQLVERLLKEADVDQWVLVSDLFKERSRDYSAIARNSPRTFEYQLTTANKVSGFGTSIRLHQHLRRMHGGGK